MRPDRHRMTHSGTKRQQEHFGRIAARLRLHPGAKIGISRDRVFSRTPPRNKADRHAPPLWYGLPLVPCFACLRCEPSARVRPIQSDSCTRALHMLHTPPSSAWPPWGKLLSDDLPRPCCFLLSHRCAGRLRRGFLRRLGPLPVARRHPRHRRPDVRRDPRHPGRHLQH